MESIKFSLSNDYLDLQPGWARLCIWLDHEMPREDVAALARGFFEDLGSSVVGVEKTREEWMGDTGSFESQKVKNGTIRVDDTGLTLVCDILDSDDNPYKHKNMITVSLKARLEGKILTSSR